MTIVVDFVNQHTTPQFITLSHSPTRGTNPNTTIVLEDITGPALQKEGRYSRPTITGQGHMCITVAVDGVDIHLEVSLDTILDFETR